MTVLRGISDLYKKEISEVQEENQLFQSISSLLKCRFTVLLTDRFQKFSEA